MPVILLIDFFAVIAVVHFWREKQSKSMETARVIGQVSFQESIKRGHT